VRIETEAIPNISVIPKGEIKTITGGDMGLGKVVYL
jgi:putative transposase